MGLIKAFAGAIGGTFADQWIDFIQPAKAPVTAGLVPAVKVGQNAGRGSNTKGSDNIITNGSKILVPDGFALVLMQDGGVTGLVTEVGGYVFNSNDPNAKSIFAGEGIVESLVKQSWNRFKYGGRPGSMQMAFYVNLREIPNNKFGTQSEIYWMDAYLNAQVAALARGTYTLKIKDPIAFLNYVPTELLINGGGFFDFGDMDNESTDQLFNEFVASLAPAFSQYANDPARGNSIMKLQSDQMGLAKCLSDVVERDYAWLTDRGISIERVAITSLEYDADTKALLSDVKKADALSGARGNSFMQQSMARGIQAAGENGGGSGIAMMGMGAGMMNQMGAGMYQQPMQQQMYQNSAQAQMFNQMQGQPMQSQQPQPQAQAVQEDPMTRLQKVKSMLDAGLISQEEFDEQKARILGAI